jgi:hypothetical protein
MSKRATLLFIAILTVSTLIMVESVFAQSIPKPSVPEFKLSYTNHIYDVPAATSQWSGEPIPNSAYHVDYREVIIKVKNQPHDVNDIREQLYYNVRVKNHFSNTWTELRGRTSTQYINGTIGTGTWYYDSADSEVTYIFINLNGPTNIIHTSTELAVGNQVDFQVKALIGYQDWENYTFFGEESPWRDTQTLTIAESQTPTPSPATTTPYQTPPSPTNYTGVHLTEQEIIAGAAITAAIIVAFLVLLIYLIKRK